MNVKATKGIHFSLSIFILIALAGCSALSAPASTEMVSDPPSPGAALPIIDTATATAAPTLIPTETPAPTATPTETPVPPTPKVRYPTLPPPKGTPVTSWNNIPILPEAIAGDAKKMKKSKLIGEYLYTVKASLEEIRAFYEEQMAAKGWKAGQSVILEGNYLSLNFENDSQECIISVAPQDSLIFQVSISLFKK